MLLQTNMIYALSLVFLTGVLTSDAAHTSPSVTSALGVINGRNISTAFKGRIYTVHRYAGLRYAKPPVGELRFQKPVPYGSFESPFDASDFTSACPQRDWLRIGVDSDDEDCLSLNVFVPVCPPFCPDGFAVMIFVHGGGFSIGGSSLYHAEVLAAVGGVIVVTFNYRLGLLGFANTGDGQFPGNMGLWDQRLAFQWVHSNIAAFGGDPSRVTIFGQSAGGSSVSLQGLYPPNQGLFQNIIVQSGSAAIPPISNNVASLSFVAASLGCATDTLNDVVTCLQNAETSVLIPKLEELTGGMVQYLQLLFFPTLDNDFITADYNELVKLSRHEVVEQIEFFRSLNLVGGINSEDGAMFLFMTGAQDFESLTISYERFLSIDVPLVFGLFINLGKFPVSDTVYKTIAHEYTDWNNIREYRGMFVKLMGDIFFNIGLREMMDVHANASASNTYFYSFDPVLGANVFPTPSWIQGANHADELLSVFGYGLPVFGDVNMSAYDPPRWELDLAHRVISYWSNFAKTGNPQSKAGRPLLHWPQHEPENPAYMRFNENDEIHHDNLYADELHFWREILPLIWATTGK